MDRHISSQSAVSSYLMKLLKAADWGLMQSGTRLPFCCSRMNWWMISVRERTQFTNSSKSLQVRWTQTTTSNICLCDANCFLLNEVEVTPERRSSHWAGCKKSEMMRITTMVLFVSFYVRTCERSRKKRATFDSYFCTKWAKHIPYTSVKSNRFW